MRWSFFAVPLAVLTVACGMQDTTTPVPQPDTLILGRIQAIRNAKAAGGGKEVEIAAGLPEEMRGAMLKSGKQPPQLASDLAVRVRVTGETVCIADLEPVDLDSFKIGQEVAVVPVGGTTAMVGSKLVLADAAEFYRFGAYQLRFLARSLATLPREVFAPADPSRINSAGLEMTPIPLQEGRVVYFAAGLVSAPGVASETNPIGAVRSGMRAKNGTLAAWAVDGFRPYRAAWGQSGWVAPTPVELPGLPADASARITWVDEGETSCLVEVMKKDGARALFSSQRVSPSATWGTLEPVKLATGGASVGDAQRLGNKLLSLVWTVYDAGASDLWFSRAGSPGRRLDPRIDTLGSEYAPRVGPGNVLYFCRGEYQLLYEGGVVHEVRLPGTQRHALLEAAPTASGERLFFRVPRYTPGQLDWNLAVAEREGSSWGKPTLLDDWKPR
jgi:hypothetical protein